MKTYKNLHLLQDLSTVLENSIDILEVDKIYDKYFVQSQQEFICDKIDVINSNYEEFISKTEVLDKKISILSMLLLYFEIKRKNLSGGLAEGIKNIIKNNKYPILYTSIPNEEIQLCEIIKFLENNNITLTQEQTNFILNLCIVSNALAVYVFIEAYKLIKISDISASLNLESVRGELGAFDKRLHELGRPFLGQIESAQNVRRIVEGSTYTTDEGRYAYGYDTHPRVQDAISLRAVPQTHGGVRDMLYRLGENIENEIINGSYVINPIIEYGLDTLIIALSDLGNISERRTFRLNDSKFSYGLPMNLIKNPGFNHGFAIVQAAQVAVLAELKLLSMPNSGIKKDSECLTYLSAIKAIEANYLLSKVLAVEIFMSCQGVDFVKQVIPNFHVGKGSKAAFDKFREYVPLVEVNRFAAPDMVNADNIVENGEILEAVEKVIGKLD